MATGPRTTRRGFVSGATRAGGAALVVAAGGLSYRAYDGGVFEAGRGDAFEAWDHWQDGAPPLALVSAAVLAASPHNSQAWTFHVTPTQIDLFADQTRSTGTLDPFDRELQVGLGCALENLLQASVAHGRRATVRTFPTPGSPVHAATVTLVAGPGYRSPLYRAIPDRRTDRSAYTTRPVPPAARARIASLARDLPGVGLQWFTTDADRNRVGTLMLEAAEAITGDQQQSRDSFRLFRSSWDEIQRHKDGLTLDAQGLSELTTAIGKLLPATTRPAGDRFWIDQTRDTQTPTAAAYGIVTVPDASDPAHRLNGGRLLQRIHLWTTANGIALQHMNQMTERVDRERQVGRPVLTPRILGLLDEAGREPLVAFRVGYADGGDGRRKSPRRPANEVTR